MGLLVAVALALLALCDGDGRSDLGVPDQGDSRRLESTSLHPHASVHPMSSLQAGSYAHFTDSEIDCGAWADAGECDANSE
jgi:hypothetical protein